MQSTIKLVEERLDFVAVFLHGIFIAKAALFSGACWRWILFQFAESSVIFEIVKLDCLVTQRADEPTKVWCDWLFNIIAVLETQWEKHNWDWVEKLFLCKLLDCTSSKPPESLSFFVLASVAVLDATVASNPNTDAALILNINWACKIRRKNASFGDKFRCFGVLKSLAKGLIYILLVGDCNLLKVFDVTKVWVLFSRLQGRKRGNWGAAFVFGLGWVSFGAPWS